MQYKNIEQRIEQWSSMSYGVNEQWKQNYSLPEPTLADVIRAEQDARDLVAHLRLLAFLIERDADLVYHDINEWKNMEWKKSS